MSKWLNKESFTKFADKKANESDEKDSTPTFFRKWNNPKAGPNGKPKEYEIRLLPSTDGGGYSEYYYHMFQSGEQWKYFLCTKTHGIDSYCPFCQVSQILYKGNANDKKKAKEYMRKQKFVSNIYIVNDPRDSEETDDNRKVSGTVRLYEFPPTVEKLFKAEITDKRSGYGMAIMDPEETGVNFLLRIESKKPDANGKVWPDYAPSMFARKPSQMVEESELEGIMASRIDLDEYLKGLELSVDEYKSILLAEMIWDDCEEQFLKHFGGGNNKVVPPKNNNPSGITEDDIPLFNEEPKKVNGSKTSVAKKHVDMDDSDADLLSQLDSL